MTIDSPTAMHTFGEDFARDLPTPAVIELIGDVGAGKTTLVKGLASGLGITETIQSPTFTISRVYDAPDGRRLYHYDFYRLSDPGIMRTELAEALSDERGIVVIEWADIVADVLPPGHQRIEITATSEDTRRVIIGG